MICNGTVRDFLTRKIVKQECIPVGCVPSAAVAVSARRGACCQWGACCRGGGCLVPGCAWSRGGGGLPAPRGGIPACTEADPPVDRMTDRCKIKVKIKVISVEVENVNVKIKNRGQMIFKISRRLHQVYHFYLLKKR